MAVSRAKVPSALREIRRLDIRIAAIVAVVQLGGTIGASRHHTHGPARCWWASGCSAATHLNGAAIVLLAVGPLALLLRRLHPRVVLATVFAATLAYVALGYLQGPNYAALLVAIVTVVIAGDRAGAGVAVVAGWVLFLWLPYALGHTGAPTPLAALSIGAWLLSLLAGSEAVRGKRERVVQTRRSREQQARSRADEERLRIARELHDVLAHSISVINVQSGVALHLIEDQPQQARIALAAINEASADALREVRSVLDVLRGTGEQPPRAPTAGLAGIDELVSRAADAGVRVALQINGERRSLPASVDLAAFRIVQESLTNIVRHAAARTATVELTYAPHELTVEIEDDGRGSATAPGGEIADGNGIAGMRERAAALGGELGAGPVAAGGFRVRARLPCEGER